MNRRADYSKNAGMTLVELLVAVTLLAIIVVPLLHAFASSARVGLKARQNLRVTTMAQALMEGLKSESIESLACSFNYPDDDYTGLANVPISTNVNSFKNFWLISPALVGGKDSSKLYELRATAVEDKNLNSYRNLSGISNISARITGAGNPTPSDSVASTLRTTDGFGYDFYQKSDQKYYYAIQDMRIENTEGDPNFKVDALIELDGSNYTSEGSDPKTSIDPSKNEVLLNEHGRINYSATDEKRDAFFLEEVALTNSVVQEFNTVYRPDTECTINDISKKIVIETVNKTASPGGETAADGVSDWIVVTCKITYTSNDHFLIPPTHEHYVPSKGVKQPYTKTFEYTIFDNKSTGYALENIYICFYPGYGNATNDEFIYINPDQVPSTLHLIKQERENNGTLNSDELRYKCKVVMQEGLGASETHPGTGNRTDSVTDLRTNIDTNLYQIYMPSAPEVRQATYYYNNSIVTRNFANPAATKIYPLGGEAQLNGQIFDVTIDIYKEGTLQKGFESGSIDSKDILFTLTGSMK